jgi:hypothetical protein
MSAFMMISATLAVLDGGTGYTKIPDEEKTELWGARFDYAYRMRGPKFVDKPNNFATAWPFSRGMTGDPSTAVMLGNENLSGASGTFEISNLGLSGNYRPYYVKGLCQDGSANAISSVNLDMFLTGTKTLVASGISDQAGYYSLPSIYFGLPHEIYANYASGTLVGASVNTLIPAP